MFISANATPVSALCKILVCSFSVKCNLFSQYLFGMTDGILSTINQSIIYL